MKIALSARMVEDCKPRPALGDFIDLARRTGYDAVGLRPWQVPPEMDDKAAEALKEKLAQTSLGVCKINTKIEEIQRVVPIARRLGVKLLRVNGTPEQWVEAARYLDEDMKLGPQMHTGGCVENVALAAKTLSRIGDRRVGVIVEPANLMFARLKWSADLFEPLRGRIIGCNFQSVEIDHGTAQVKMTDGSAVNYIRVTLEGNSQIDLPGFLKALQAVGYDGMINVIEPAREPLTIEQLAGETAAALRKQMKEAGA